MTLSKDSRTSRSRTPIFKRSKGNDTYFSKKKLLCVCVIHLSLIRILPVLSVRNTFGFKEIDTAAAINGMSQQKKIGF